MSAALPAHVTRSAAGAAPAIRSPWALGFARAYARRACARSFDGVWLAGLDAAREALARGPLLIAANHVSWWDPLLLVLLDEALGGEGAVLMDADNLRKVPYMRWLGAIPLARRDGASARAGLRAGATWLDRPGRALFIFPQGRQRPSHLRPLGFQRGVELVARMSAAPVLPMAVTYGWRESQLPSAVVSFGPVAAEASTEALERGVEAQLARLDRFLDGASPASNGDDAPMEPLVAPAAARPDDGLGARLLAWTSREPTPPRSTS